MKKIIYYQKENGKIPVKDFLDETLFNNKKLGAKIFSKLEMLSFWILTNKDTKYIQDKIYELRIRDGNNISRIFYFTFLWENIIVLDWIIKKDNKLKNRDIERSVWYKKDFIKRFGNI